MQYFKKKYGVDGHLHFDAPQCSPLWLYAPVQVKKLKQTQEIELFSHAFLNQGLAYNVGK
jgi:hypothetical protein